MQPKSFSKRCIYAIPSIAHTTRFFYIADPLLNEKELRFSKHGSVHGAFAQHYVKAKIFAEKYHKRMTGAFRRRMPGDYDKIARFNS